LNLKGCFLRAPD